MGERIDEWVDWTNEALLEYEQQLYDQDVAGEDTWATRDAVLWEINWRGLWQKEG